MTPGTALRTLKTSTLAAALILTPLILSSCDEQKVLYVTEAEEEIPPVPKSPLEAMPQGHPTMEDVPTDGLVPPPTPVDFTRDSIDIEMVTREFAGINVQLPRSWESTPPSSSMRLAEFRIPSSKGGEDANLVLFAFGPGQGGNMIQNVQRWAGQFTPSQGRNTPVIDFTMDPNVKALRVSRIMLEGRYAPSAMGPGAPTPEPRDDWMLDGLIIEEGPEGTLFLRLTGPHGLIHEQEEIIEYIASTLSPKGADSRDVTVPLPSADDEEPQLALVRAPGVSFAIPADWKREESASQMRAFQFAFGNDGEFVVFYFGESGGGSVEDNFDRWAGQIKKPDGSNPMDSAIVEETDINGLKVSSIYLEGTYAPSAMGPMAPAPDPEDGYALMGMIIEGGSKGTLYCRLTGPIDEVKSQRESLGTILGTLEATD